MKKQGSILGGTLLITGSCIGAGMLGLPILTGLAGFFPTFMMFVIAWLLMTITSLLMIETLGWFDRPVNLISMVSHTLGPIGKSLCWLLYLFLFYALLVAYMSVSGNHVAAFFKHSFNLDFPNWGGTLFFVIFFGWIVYLGTRRVDHLNRLLMFGKIGAYLLLLVLGARYINPDLLLNFKPQYALMSFPILIVSFGFQNMIPSLFHYMGGDRRRVRQAIWYGSIFAFLIYFLWEIIALGILPLDVIHTSFKSGIDGAQAMRNYLGSSWIGYSAQVLAFFAILTSFLAQSLSLVHFLRDGLKLKKKKQEHVSMCALALIPPLFFSLAFPKIFFHALNFAGGICAMVLFGIFPVLMTWIGRYHKKHLLKDRVKGGKCLLIAIFTLACFIFMYQLSKILGLQF